VDRRAGDRRARQRFSIRVPLAAAAACLLPTLALYRRARRAEAVEAAAVEPVV
jgi:hypothetical protein